jgi:hypothetical protein
MKYDLGETVEISKTSEPFRSCTAGSRGSPVQKQKAIQLFSLRPTSDEHFPFLGSNLENPAI